MPSKLPIYAAGSALIIGFYAIKWYQDSSTKLDEPAHSPQQEAKASELESAPSAKSASRTSQLRPETSDPTKNHDERYERLAAKSLLTQKEKQEFRELINDPEWLKELVLRLKPGQSKTFDLNVEKQRLQALEGLSKTLVYGNEASREIVRLAMIELIEDQSYRQLEDQRLKKSFIGDKIEQLLLLHKLDPQSFTEISQMIQRSDDKALKFALRSVNNLQGSR